MQLTPAPSLQTKARTLSCGINATLTSHLIVSERLKVLLCYLWHIVFSGATIFVCVCIVQVMNRIGCFACCVNDRDVAKLDRCWTELIASLNWWSCAGQGKDIPDETYVAIETLLPTGKGKFLELWAARNVHRPGWTHIVETSVKTDIKTAFV